MIYLIYSLIVLLINKFQCVPSNYFVTAPNNIRPGYNYTISVALFNNKSTSETAKDDAVNMEAKLINRAITPVEVIAKAAGNFNTKGTHNLTIKIPNKLKEGVYTLVVMSPDLPNMKEEIELAYNKKRLSIFITTDKAIYKPSDHINFRVIVLDSNLRPLSTKMNFTILDPKENRLVQYLNQSLTLGSFKGSFKLSDKTILGVWSLQCSVHEVTEVERVTVEEYVLPLFEVTLSAPQFVEISSMDTITVRGSIEAKYTFGGIVSGLARISFQDQSSYYDPFYQTYHSLERQMSLHVKGEVTPFELKLDIKGKSYISSNDFEWGRSFNLSVTLNDTLTSTVRNKSQIITVVRHPIQIKFEGPTTFKNGLPLPIKIIVHRIDGAPLNLKPSDPAEVEIIQSENYAGPNENPKRKEAIVLKIPKTGIIDWITNTSFRDAIYAITINVRFKQSPGKIYSHYVTAFRDPANIYISLHIPKRNYKIGQIMQMTVRTTTQNFDFIRLLVISRGVIVQYIKVSFVGLQTIIPINVTAPMCPYSKILGYLVTKSLHVAADSGEIICREYSQNKVSLQTIEVSSDLGSVNTSTNTNDDDKVSTIERKPGQSVTFQIKTTQNSLVGLAAVDKSVLLMGEANALSSDRILTEIASYEYGNYIPIHQRGRIDIPALEEAEGLEPQVAPTARMHKSTDRRKRRNVVRRPFYPGNAYDTSGSSSYSLFKACGLIVLTNFPDFKPNQEYSRLSKTVGAIPMAQFAMEGPARMEAMEDKGSSALSSMPSNQPKISVRKRFPESWIWADINMNSNSHIYDSRYDNNLVLFSSINQSRARLSNNAKPITSKKIQVSLKFFIALNLPYSVVRGEMVKLEVIVYNYLPKSVKAKVELQNSKDFALDKNTNPIQSKNIPNNRGSKVFYSITPTKIGLVKIKVTATAGAEGDGIEKFLLVKGEGRTLYVNKPYLLVSSGKMNLNKTLPITWPKDIVPASQFLEVSVIGDLMGPSLANIGHLIRMPIGCGEQNMLNFAPNLYIYNYLKLRQLLNQDDEKRLIQFTQGGYQRQLSFQRKDGSFSAFGETDSKGSVWLTAFVVKSFILATNIEIIYVEQTIILKGLQFLLASQLDDGSFKETGTIHHASLQGGTGRAIALTAYVFTVLKDAFDYFNETGVADLIKPKLDRTHTYLVRLVQEGLGDIKPYDLAILTYALNLDGNNRDVAARSLKRLKTLAIVKDDYMYWNHDPSDGSSNGFCPKSTGPAEECKNIIDRTSSLDFEATSYGLLTFALRKDRDAGIPILKWLLSKRTSIGGYSSTQDTITALMAISEFAKDLELSTDPILTVEIRFKKNKPAKHEFKIDRDTQTVLQTYHTNTLESEITILGKGTGSALVQVSWSYNKLEGKNGKWFSLKIRKSKSIGYVEICTRYLLGVSNMAILEINAPSGETINRDSIQALNLTSIKYFELEEGNTKANIYFNSVGNNEICLSLSLIRVYDVKNVKPAQVKISDYYEPNKYEIGQLLTT